MAHDDGTFLKRWARLKAQSKNLPETKDESAAPVLPPVDKLTPESDFSGFMHPKVEDALRRAALKKLFNDPHFNTADPFEPFSGDWTGGEPISEEMLATLNQARTLLFDQENKNQEPKTESAEAVPDQTPQPKNDEPGRENT